MEIERVLVIENEKKFRDALLTILHVEGYHAIGAGSVSEVKDLLKKRCFHVVLMALDNTMPSGNGDLIKWFQRYRPELPLVFLGEEPWYESSGNYEDNFIQKPMQVDDVHRMIRIIHSVVEEKNQRQRGRQSQD